MGLSCTAAQAAPRAKAPPPDGIYQPVGAPADPKVSIRWDRYYDHAEVSKLLHALVAAHPHRARLESLGKSYGNRDMWVLTVTNFGQGDDRGKPAFWIDGAIHGNEIQGTEVTLYTAWYLLEMYGRAPFVTRLVDQRTFYFLPMLSPDARDAHLHGPASTNSPRSGLRPVDNDRDGLFDEDGPDDLDGDGNITQMRVRDPNGRWKSHPKYPDLMIPCADDEPGQYRLLGEEGFDNDGDGRIDEDGPGGYDPNRDWGWNWQPGYVQHGAYRYPFSVLENRMAADFIMAHPNIAGAQSYHNCGGWILRGPGGKDEHFDPEDVRIFDAIGKKGEMMLPGYRYITVAQSLYEVCGAEHDWLYTMQGVFTFTNELFTPFNYFRRTAEKGGPAGEEEMYAFDKYLLFGQGLVPWKEVEHPQFGRIEVGGLKKTWGRQPPSFLLEEECHRNMAFTLYHADQMPKIEVQSLQTRPLPGGLTQVTAVVANPKVIPTHAAVDVKHKITPADSVAITGKDLQVLLGMQSDTPFFENAKEQKKHPEKLRVDTIPGMGAVYVRWIVRGQAPFTVTASAIKGGTVQRQSGG
jgi:hypothetical protein